MSNCSWTWGDLNAHRLHPPGDFSLKERVNVNDSTDYSGAVGGGRVTYMAIQHWLGIFSERRARSRTCDLANSGTDGASLVGSSMGLRNFGQIASAMRIHLHARPRL